MNTLNGRESAPSHRPEPDPLTYRALARSDAWVVARRRVFRQLIESMIYEKIVAPEIASSGPAQTFSIPGRDERGEAVTYACEGRRRFSFDRIRLSSAPVRRTAGGQTGEAESISQFLLETWPAHGANAERLSQFIAELEQTILKDAQALAFAREERRPLRGRPYDEVESALPDGHPYHPSYKSRVGFDLADNLRFGPEFSPLVRPIWIAAHREWTRVSVSAQVDLATFLRREIGEEAFSCWMGDLRRYGEPGEYVLLPVHPWQWRAQITAHLCEDIRDGRIVPLGVSQDAYRPQQSIRTLANVTSPAKASLKHALSLVNTSTSRILAPHTVQNAPLISDWLHGIARADPFLRDELRPVILREVVGVAYDRPRPDLLHERTYGILSCIFRESLHPALDQGEEAVPWTALCHVDRDGRPFIEPWVRGGALEPWLRRLLEVSVLPVIHFLVGHGIALESHAQNMLLIHRAGAPTRVGLKDFHDGVRFSPACLAAPDRQPPLYPTPARHVRVNRNSFITTERPGDVRDFVLDAFFFINLAELAMFLADHFGLEEPRFWGIVDEVLSAYRARFRDLAPRFELFALGVPMLHVERLTNRRMFPETDVQVHSVPNPLALGAHRGQSG
ncbi:IucA/IucC family protein [Sorangium sp. So ce119]|uniref:IucA/IucC family protein n=1 Tax=Sorangium sp. So ce119 TaxID=3133279 RepID=UPI003F60093D